jgi:hypothetical protein
MIINYQVRESAKNAESQYQYFTFFIRNTHHFAIFADRSGASIRLLRFSGSDSKSKNCSVPMRGNQMNLCLAFVMYCISSVREYQLQCSPWMYSCHLEFYL